MKKQPCGNRAGVHKAIKYRLQKKPLTVRMTKDMFLLVIGLPPKESAKAVI